jgi:hypothetical protein
MTQYPASHPPPPYAGSAPAPTKPKNWIGATALGVAILGLVGSVSVVGGVALGVTAIIVGFSGRRRAKRGEATNGEVATAGIVLGALAIVVSLAVIAIWVRGYQEVDFGSYVNCVTKSSEPQHVEKCANEFQQRLKDKLGLKGST